MGASSNKKRNLNLNKELYMPALFESFLKIKEFREYFKFQKDIGELSKIFNSLIQNNQLLDGHVFEFNKLVDKRFKVEILNIQKLIIFILDTLHEEQNKNKNKENKEDIQINHKNELETYKAFIDYYYKNNKSIIQDLFYGEKEIIEICSKCKINLFHFDIIKVINFDLKNYKEDCDIRDLIKDYEKQYEIITLCNYCNENSEILNAINIKKLPEIFIFSFDYNNYNKTIKYYLNYQIKDEPYLLICFIINADENNKKVENYNVFYEEDEKWYMFDVNEKKIKNVDQITKITNNPLVTFYQKKITHDKIFMNRYYNRLSLLFQNLKEIQKMATQKILDENKFYNYYIINKKWFNKLVKIFESNEKYENDNLIFNTFNQVTNIPNLNINELKDKVKTVLQRIKNLEKEEIFKPHFETETESKINYPKDFILIKENDLDELLKDLNIKIPNIKNYLFEIMIGENYLFIKNKNSNIYFICYPLLYVFNVEKILKFNDQKTFSHEIKYYIKNKGGLDYYFMERRLNINIQGIQKIIDKENEEIGEFINIIENNTMVNLNQFYYNKNRNFYNY